MPRCIGGTKGNYGIAIILLTFLVRLVLFPLGRKQAMSAQKMQELQPYLKEIQEKYKDDKERLTKETFAVYKKHSFNPFGGCLPAVVQLPIFVGLWQALNTSVVLRHASFLWIRDLAAPDMMFQFPGGTEIPFLGKWFNILPLVVVSLMLVQTKLFSPPATTPEAEMNQKMMKYMMAFMAVMFYKVPAGLGIYFITSSLWSIGERLLIPKLQARKKGKGPGEDGKWTSRELAGRGQGRAAFRASRQAAGTIRAVLGAHPRRGAQGPDLPQSARQHRPEPQRSGQEGPGARQGQGSRTTSDQTWEEMSRLGSRLNHA